MSQLARLVRELDRRLRYLEDHQSTGGGRTGYVVAVDPSSATVDVALDADQTVIVPGVPVDGAYAVPEVGHAVVLRGDVAPVATAPVSPVAAATPPQVIGVTVIGDVGTLQIHWDPVNVTSISNNKGAYELEVDVTDTFDSVTRIHLAVAATAKTVSGLGTGTPYFVRVRAVNYQGVEGPWSAVVEASTNLDAIAGQIGSIELQDGSVTDAKFADYQWGFHIPTIGQGVTADIAVAGGIWWRALGATPSAGRLVVMKLGLSFAGAGTAGSPIKITTPPELAAWLSTTFADGHGYYVDNTAARTAVTIEYDDSGASTDFGHLIFFRSGAVYNTEYGADPNYAVHAGDALRGTVVAYG